jgi:lipopolysaccharide transport system ATP-binding protein
VGDAEFQKKCLGKMKDVAGHGRTILFVSHNMKAVQSLCQRGILLKNGTLEGVYDDPAKLVISYHKCVGNTASGQISFSAETAPTSGKVRLNSISVVPDGVELGDHGLFGLDTPLKIIIQYEVLQKNFFHFSLLLYHGETDIAFTTRFKTVEGWQHEVESGNYTVQCHIPANLLNEGEYYIRLLCVENLKEDGFDVEGILKFEIHDLEPRGIGAWHGIPHGVIRPNLKWTFA